MKRDVFMGNSDLPVCHGRKWGILFSEALSPGPNETVADKRNFLDRPVLPLNRNG